MALKEDSLSIDAPKLMNEDKLAIVLGTEGDGLAPETIAACDDTVCIPMAHGRRFFKWLQLPVRLRSGSLEDRHTKIIAAT